MIDDVAKADRALVKKALAERRRFEAMFKEAAEDIPQRRFRLGLARPLPILVGGVTENIALLD